MPNFAETASLSLQQNPEQLINGQKQPFEKKHKIENELLKHWKEIIRLYQQKYINAITRKGNFLKGIDEFNESIRGLIKSTKNWKTFFCLNQ